MQAIQCTDRLAAAVYDGTEAFAGNACLFTEFDRPGVSFPIFAQLSPIPVGELKCCLVWPEPNS